MTTHCSRWIGMTMASSIMILAGSIGSLAPFASFVGDAYAVVGRPATPGSVAGAARRTTRRVVRRSTIYASTLPAGCVQSSVNGGVVWRCGSTYYQPYGGRYVVVYID